MTKKINYIETDLFKKDFKKLSKKLKTLVSDLDVAKRNAIELFHVQNIDNDSVEKVPGFPHEFLKIYKIRKFACKALKGRGVKSGVRVIYAYHLEKMTVIFIEIYFKPDQKNENKDRIYDAMKNL